jgi:hypothetical protein
MIFGEKREVAAFAFRFPEGTESRPGGLAFGLDEGERRGVLAVGPGVGSQKSKGAGLLVAYRISQIGIFITQQWQEHIFSTKNGNRMPILDVEQRGTARSPLAPLSFSFFFFAYRCLSGV